VKQGGRELVYEASLCSSEVYESATKLCLTKQYRAAADDKWADAMHDFGHGRSACVRGHEGNDAARGVSVVRMPLVNNVFYAKGKGKSVSDDDDEYRQAALEWLYGRDEHGELNFSGKCTVRGCACSRPGQGQRTTTCRKAILCTTNEAGGVASRDAWNEYVSKRRAESRGVTAERSYAAYHDKSVAANVDVAAELLASALGDDDLETLRHDASVPPANVTFREGDDVLLMQTMDKTEGLVNNVRLKVVALRANSVLCALEHQHGVTTHHVIYRRPFTIEVGKSGISVTRKQMPLVRAYALVRCRHPTRRSFGRSIRRCC
jgi:hypothetical protein